MEERRKEKSEFIKAKIKEIREKIVRPCTEFETKKFKYDDENKISWIGRVFLCKENEVEERPKDNKGQTMYPLAQFYLPNLPYLPEALKKFEYITVFMGEDFPEYDEEWDNGNGWILRTYTKNDKLVKNEYLRDDNICPDPYPLKPKLIKTDYPVFDGGGLSEEVEKEIEELSEEMIFDKEKDDYVLENNPNKFDYYEDIAIEFYPTHKFGGYPSYCQSGLGLEPAKDYHFVFQISSDGTANYNVVDSGSLMFFYNENEDKWIMYYDFY